MPSSILSVIWMTMFRDYSKFFLVEKDCNSSRTTFRAAMAWILRLVSLEYKRFYKAEGMFESLRRTVTCTRELISIYMCYSQGDGLNTSLSRLLYLVLYTVVQLSTCRCTLSLYGAKYPMYWTRIWMIYKLRLPLHLQPLHQPQHKQFTRTRMLELRTITQ